ncbi:MAG: GNAT family N-acetyltransferase [Allosphingosinicella sp.]
MRTRRATAQDAAAIASVYAPYVMASVVSFETEAPDEAEMRGRIEALGDLYPWLVACDEDGRLCGYAYGCAFRARPAYRFAVETTVYVADHAHRRGTGSLLYRALLAVLEAQGFAQAIGAITIPNQASVALHERLGFRQTGVYERVGFKFGEWRSVSLWQRGLAPLSTRPEEPRPVSAIWKS